MESTSFTDALAWLADWIDREVEIVVSAGGHTMSKAGGVSQAVIEGRLTTSWDPAVMHANGIEDAAVLHVGRSLVTLNAGDFDLSSREADGSVRLRLGDLEVRVGSPAVGLERES